MKKMRIYEPALCCETGVCGVGVDPELLRISTVLNSMKQNGVDVDRFNLNVAPMEFITNSIVNDYLNKQGADCLPIVLLDNEIIITGRYPSNDEFISYLGINEEILKSKSKAEVQEESGCCGTNNSSCC